MVQQYGLGRGLASLIPSKKKTGDEGETEASHQGVRLPDGQGFSSRTPVFAPDSTPARSESSVSSPASPRRAESSGEMTKNSSSNNGMTEVAVEKIVSNPHQPRLHFDKTKLEELAASIKEHGILQPLIVSPLHPSSGEASQDGERYELIAGERRFQAAKMVGLRTVPIVIRSVTEQEKLELAIIENIQRHDLNPIEEAKAYLRLLDEFSMQQEAVAKKMGKSRSAIANTLRLLHLPIEIQRAVAEGIISEGHAKALLSIENPEKQRAVFDLIVKEELTVRETELQVRSITVSPYVRSAVPIHPEILQRSEHLTQILGTKVKIMPLGKGGKIMIEYYSSEDLDGLLKRLEE
ncbi:MAG: ParB/RepB/Spo0J family partition protein [Candidatus Moranbacteria bacterium]|nr:ParB/RepB/Spo0J family partition protein [Candidatus Moranbacteria bacterium]